MVEQDGQYIRRKHQTVARLGELVIELDYELNFTLL